MSSSPLANRWPASPNGFMRGFVTSTSGTSKATPTTSAANSRSLDPDLEVLIKHQAAAGTIRRSAWCSRADVTPAGNLLVQLNRDDAVAAGEDVGEQRGQAGREEPLVGCGGQLLGRPPALVQQRELFVGGVADLCACCCAWLGQPGQVDPLAAVVVPAAEAEAGVPDPHVRADLAQLDSSLFGKFALACLGGGLAGLEATAGQFPPAAVGLCRVMGVQQQQPVVWVQ